MCSTTGGRVRFSFLLIHRLFISSSFFFLLSSFFLFVFFVFVFFSYPPSPSTSEWRGGVLGGLALVCVNVRTVARRPAVTHHPLRRRERAASHHPDGYARRRRRSLPRGTRERQQLLLTRTRHPPAHVRALAGRRPRGTRVLACGGFESPWNMPSHSFAVQSKRIAVPSLARP